MTDLPSSPAAERNKQPILEVLQRVLPASGRLLELASGTGQHAAWLSLRLPGWQWQPTEVNSAALPTIAAWSRALQATQVLPPFLLNASESEWPVDEETLVSVFDRPFDAVYCANLLHISPASLCAPLMAGAARHLVQGGLLLIYGPFIEDGIETSPGNLAFDASLRNQNPGWGIRHLNEVERIAKSAGLLLRERIAMPANNLMLVFAKT